MTVIDSKTWPVDNQRVRAQKGKLIRVVKRKGLVVKMYETDAIDQGYIKSKPQAENKMRTPTENKAEPEAEAEETPKADDFSSIPGIGKATARALVAHGITTFEQLRQAGKLGYLTSKAAEAVEAWRSNG